MSIQATCPIILIHPNPCFSQSFCEHLRDAGKARVAQAPNLQDSLPLIAEAQLVIIGYNLNAHQSFRWCRTLHQQMPRLKPMLLCSDAHNLLAQADAAYAGARACVWVNHPFADYLPVIADVLAGKTLIPSEALQAAMQPAEPTARERDIARLWAEDADMLEKEMAVRLSVSINTIHSHIKNIYAKLRTHKRSQAILRALRRGWAD